MLHLRKCTEMNVYRLLKCLNCLKRLKRAVKRRFTLWTTRIVKNIREIGEFIREYRCLNIQTVAELTKIAIELYLYESFKIQLSLRVNSIETSCT